MRVLVTGAAGFLGSHVAERLVEGGHEVVGLDSFDPFYDPAAKRRNVAALVGRAGFLLERGDLCDGDLVARLVRGVDVCCHLAALAGVRPSWADPLRYWRVNVGGTLGLLQACRRAQVGRFVLASSSSVYGARADAPFRETDPCGRPASPYAASKRAAEGYLPAYRRAGLAAVALRYFTVYGPRQRPDMAIHKFARLIEEERPVPVYGGGASARDYTYVDDAVDGTVAAVELAAPGVRGVYNLGGGRMTALADLVALLERALGRRARIERRPAQPGDVPLTCADIEAARRDLGYAPRVSIEEGLARFVRWRRT